MCIGCGYCAIACPYRARTMVHDHEYYFMQATPSEKKPREPERHGVMTKCTFCKHRVAKAPAGAPPGVAPAYTPACVPSPPATAMHFADRAAPTCQVSHLADEHPPGRPRSAH